MKQETQGKSEVSPARHRPGIQPRARLRRPLKGAFKGSPSRLQPAPCCGPGLVLGSYAGIHPRADRVARRLLLALLLVLGCGAPQEGTHETSTDPLYAWPQLATIPHPPLDTLAPDVRGPLEEQRRILEALLEDAAAPPEDAAAPPEELAAAMGDLARLYHGYDLTAAARASYRNAVTLQPTEHRWQYLLGLLSQTTGDLGDAAASFQAALEAAPEDLPTRLRLGEVELARHRPAAAREQFEAVLEAVEGAVEGESGEVQAAAHFGLGRAAVAEEETAAAVGHFEAALAANSEAGGVRYPLAQAYRKLGRLDEAREQLDLGGSGGVPFPDPLAEEVTAAAAGGTALARRGDEALMAGELEQAVDLYREALEKTPDNGEARRNLALALTRDGDPPAALKVLDEAVRRHPQGVWLHFDRGNNLLALGRGPEALEAFRRSVELAPDFASGHFSLANVLGSAGRWGDARGHLEKVLELRPGDLRARYQLAVARYESGEKSEGLAALEALTKEERDFLPARQSLGALYQQQGKRDLARRQYAAMLEVATNPRARAAAYVLLAGLSAGRGGRHEALAQLDRAIELAPDLAEAHINRATLLQQVDRLADAQASYRRAVDLKPEDSDLRNREGTALILLGRYGDARQRLEAALETIPGNPALSHTLARLLATAPDAAVRDGQEALRLAQVAYGHQRSLEHAETLAMALAEQGNFSQAAQIQAGLLMQARQLRNPSILQHLQSNLQRYQRGEPVRIEAP